MRTKKVSRYWCDHCNKAGLQARAMVRHEQHCTMNPARTCRVCALISEGSGEDASAPLAELIAMLPEHVEYSGDCWGKPSAAYVAFCDALKAATPALRTATNGCPACFLAALRQKKIYVSMVEGFDFRAEMKSIFDDMNAFRAEQGDY